MWLLVVISKADCEYLLFPFPTKCVLRLYLQNNYRNLCNSNINWTSIFSHNVYKNSLWYSPHKFANIKYRGNIVIDTEGSWGSTHSKMHIIDTSAYCVRYLLVVANLETSLLHWNTSAERPKLWPKDSIIPNHIWWCLMNIKDEKQHIQFLLKTNVS